MNPRISIIVPCYNQASYIGHTLDSVLAQTYPHWECIVMDDGSADNTREVVQAYCQKDARIRYYRQENAGVSRARNNAVKQAAGEFLLPLDGDDLIGPTYVEEALRYFQERPGTKLVYCLARRFGDVNEPWLLPEYRYEWLVIENMIFCSAVFRKADFEKAGGYNENMATGLEDWDFYLNLLGPQDKVYRIPKVLFFYRTRTNTRTQDATLAEKELTWQIMQNHPDLYKEYLLRFRRMHRNRAACLTYEAEKKLGHILTKPLRMYRQWKLLRMYRAALPSAASADKSSAPSE